MAVYNHAILEVLKPEAPCHRDNIREDLDKHYKLDMPANIEERRNVYDGASPVDNPLSSFICRKGFDRVKTDRQGVEGGVPLVVLSSEYALTYFLGRWPANVCLIYARLGNWNVSRSK